MKGVLTLTESKEEKQKRLGVMREQMAGRWKKRKAKQQALQALDAAEDLEFPPDAKPHEVSRSASRTSWASSRTTTTGP